MYLWKLLGYDIEQNDNEGYQNIQQRLNNKKAYYKKVTENFTDLKNSLNECYKKLNILKNKLSELEENKDMQEIIQLIYNKISNNQEEDIDLVDNIISNLNEHIEDFREENKLYKEFKISREKLEEEKNNLYKCEEDYQKTGKNSEKYILNYIQNNKNSFDNILKDNYELNNIGNQYKKSLNNYNNAIKKVQELTKDYNNIQNKFYDYLPNLEKRNRNLFKNIIKLFNINILMEEKQLIFNKSKIKEINKIEIDNELNEIIKDIKKLKKEEKEVKPNKYETEIDFNKCKDDKEFSLFSKSAMIINKYLDEKLFEYFDEEKEKKKFEVIKFIKDLFEDKIIINEKTTDIFLEKLKYKFVHKATFIVLSNLRAKSNFKKSKALIELLAKGFNYLLSHVNKGDIFEYMKNCIIISQTYYYIDENNNKIYLIKLIKNNKYLNNSYFWREFIKYAIDQELTKFRKLNYLSILESESETYKLNKENEINEIVFSQMISYINNIFEFDINKRIIVKIVDELIKDYNCLSETNLENIYDIISTDKNEIEELRNEYSPSLESESFIINEDNEKQNEIINSLNNNQLKEKDEIKNHNINKGNLIIEDQEILDMINNEENDF